MMNAPMIASTASTTKQNIYIGTPQGAVGAYADVVNDKEKFPDVHVRKIMWFEHPHYVENLRLDPDSPSGITSDHSTIHPSDSSSAPRTAEVTS